MTDNRTKKASDVLDNPEWSEADIRKGARLSDFAPALAANIHRDLTEPEKPCPVVVLPNVLKAKKPH